MKNTRLILLMAGLGVFLLSIFLVISVLDDSRGRGGQGAVSTETSASAAGSSPSSVMRDGCRYDDKSMTDDELIFDGESALIHIKEQVDLGPRITGSAASIQASLYIKSQLEAYGWTAEFRDFIYMETHARNIVGRSGPSDGPVFIIGAHYDTRRIADRDSQNPDAPVPGANDGASGVAVLLELARTLDLSSVDGQVWLVFFDAEDNGQLDGWDWILGSREFVRTLEIVPEYAIIVDMVGDADQDIYQEANSNQTLTLDLWAIADEMGCSEYLIPIIKHSILDDHTPFLEAGVPAVDVIDFDYAFWHTTEDTVDKVSPASLARVGRILEIFLERGGAFSPRRD